MLTERQQQDIREFWPVYRQAQDEVTEATLADLRDEEPSLAAILEPEANDERTQETNRLTEQGVLDGDWEPFCDSLRELGRSFADLGMSFADWFRLSSIYRPYLIPHVIAAHRGDEERLASALRGLGEYFDLALRTIGESYLANREERIAKHQQAIAELSTPVLSIRPGLLLLPIVGVLDSQRSRQLTEGLLYAVRDHRARVVVMDITGVAEVDTEVANRLVQTAEAARLMGADPILTGISTGVAQTLVALGVDLKGIETVGDLQGGVELADRLLGAQPGVPRDGGR
jgi:rsbT co-antagonist protein RsbR